MTVANRLFRTFCHSSCFPLLQSQTFGWKKMSKKYMSPFLAHFHRTAACRTPRAVSEEGAEDPPSSPRDQPCQYNEVQRGKHPNWAAIHLLCTARCNPATLSPPIQSISSTKVNGNDASSLLKASLRVLSEAVIATPEGTPRPCTAANWREIISGTMETGRSFAQKTFSDPSFERPNPPVSSPCN